MIGMSLKLAFFILTGSVAVKQNYRPTTKLYNGAVAEKIRQGDRLTTDGTTRRPRRLALINPNECDRQYVCVKTVACPKYDTR